MRRTRREKEKEEDEKRSELITERKEFKEEKGKVMGKGK